MLNVRPGRPGYDGIDFLRSGDRKTRLFVALRSKSKSKQGLANLLKHAEARGLLALIFAGVYRKLRDARGSEGRDVAAPIGNDRFPRAP
jgi:hypothetical protein